MHWFGNARMASVLLVATVSCGCAGPTTWNGGAVSAQPAGTPLAGGTPYPATPGAPAAADGGSPASTPIAQAMQPANPLGQEAPRLPTAQAVGSGSMLFASLRRAGDALLDAVEIEPHVTPAADPIRLDNRPANPASVSADLHYHAGRVFESNDNLQLALGHYQDALTRNPDDVRLLASYARVLDRLGRFTEAEAAYRRAIELNPMDASASNDLAMCYARQGKWDPAIGTLQRAVRIDPTNPLFRNNLALILVDAGRTEEAFQQLLAAHGEAAAHYNLGYMLLERRNQPAAEQHFQRALELNPRLTEAQQMLTYLQAARHDQVTGASPTAGAPGVARLPRTATR